MTKREMMDRYYDEVQLHSAELSLKYGIEDGSIRLVGDRISGKTYDARLAIKQYFGATWMAAEKCWKINRDHDFARVIFTKGLIV